MTVVAQGPTAGWTSMLDLVDDAVDAAWVAIGRGDLDEASEAIDELEHLATLPPLPDELSVRARSVLERLCALDAQLEAARVELRRELQVAQRLAPTGRSVPRFIDRTS